MKSQSMLLTALASAPAALAHTVFTNFYVDGVSQGDGVAMRMSPFPETAGSPISSLNSDDMACNVGGTKGVSRVQSVNDGAVLTFEIRGWANDPSKGSIDRGHYGPCAVYLKKVESAVTDKGTGDGWFKIFDHGYDGSTKRWCTDEIIDNNGRLSVNLPKGLQGGDYLARPEILALHAAADPKPDPQTYTGCAQIFLESTGNLGPDKTVSIPGALTYEQKGTTWNIYDSNNADYPIPGPSVAKLVAKSNQASISSSSQSNGLKPEGCIVENANWCGKEVSSYSDQKGCWSAVDDCWAQSKVCWDTAPPTGGAGCEIWTTKCNELNDQCNGGNFNGPPNKGKVLTPQPKSIDVGQIMATVGGGMVDGPAPKTSETKKPESKTETPAQQTPAAEEDEEPAQAPAKTTSPAAAPKPSAPASKPSPSAAKPTNSYPAPPTPEKEADENNDDEDDDAEEDDETPAPTTTPAPAAPKPSKGPACIPGKPCITVTEVEVVTQTVYVTAGVGGYKRSLESFRARRRWAHRA